MWQVLSFGTLKYLLMFPQDQEPARWTKMAPIIALIREEGHAHTARIYNQEQSRSPKHCGSARGAANDCGHVVLAARALYVDRFAVVYETVLD